MSTEYYMDGRTYYLAYESSNYLFYKDDEGNEFKVEKSSQDITDENGNDYDYNTRTGKFVKR